MGMAMEGIDIAVLFRRSACPFMARDTWIRNSSAAICRAYNDWLHDFVQYSPDQLEDGGGMLPVHDVNLACAELHRCVKEYGAVGAFVRPNYGQRPLLALGITGPALHLLQELNIPLCFHEGTGSYYSTIEPRFCEKRFMRHVASHSTEDAIGADRADARGISNSIPGSGSRSSRRRAGGCQPARPHRMDLPVAAPSGGRALI